MSKKTEEKYKCKLLPYERIECLSIQDASQKAGWGITAFNLPKTWQYTQGEGVKIAVVDTGCDLDHPDLKDNLAEGINFIHPGTPPEDDNCHGTHVTGILVAANNDIGMVGVCPKAKVMPVKVLNSKGSGNLLDVAKGVVWAVDNGADIITMSLGSPMKVQQVRKAIQYAASKGVPTFVAAGNAGNTKEVFYPANYPETIAIGAIDENFARAKFSNTGRNLDFMAPGVDIFSTLMSVKAKSKSNQKQWKTTEKCLEITRLKHQKAMTIQSSIKDLELLTLGRWFLTENILQFNLNLSSLLILLKLYGLGQSELEEFCFFFRT